LIIAIFNNNRGYAILRNKPQNGKYKFAFLSGAPEVDFSGPMGGCLGKHMFILIEDLLDSKTNKSKPSGH